MTFSIAARCAATGMLGAAVTTSSSAVGARCIHARARVGVVLTQFWTDPRLGPRGLALLGEGLAAAEVRDAVMASTPDRDWRQLGVLGADGSAAHATGPRTKPAQAAVTGRDCVALGNILRNEHVPAAMVAAFEASAHAALAERLLAALDAGLAAGGEENPLVSAALLVVRDEPFPFADLRVDASDDPLGELRRVWTVYAPVAETYVARALTPRHVDTAP